jgi:16S rRNA (uracil1498-N3)-methyltransferase
LSVTEGTTGTNGARRAERAFVAAGDRQTCWHGSSSLAVADRYYLPELPRPGPARLAGAVAHHLVDVMRVRAGQQVVLFDGRGHEADVVVSATARRQIDVDVLAVRQAPRAALRRVEVAFSPPRGSRLAEILEHGTELGVAAFHPVAMQHTPRAQRRAMDQARCRRIVAAAAGQCGTALLAEVHPLRSLAELIAQVLPAFAGEAWLATPAPWRPARPEPPHTLPPALAIIGPEGGLGAEEAQALRAAGCRDLGLGPHVLRIETAALAAAALLLLAPP